MSNGYAIENWSPAQPIYNKLHYLTSQPIYCVNDEELEKDLA